MIRTGEQHRFGAARWPRRLMLVGGAANCFHESVTPLASISGLNTAPQPLEAGPAGPGFTASRPPRSIGTDRQCRRASAVPAC